MKRLYELENNEGHIERVYTDRMGFLYLKMLYGKGLKKDEYDELKKGNKDENK